MRSALASITEKKIRGILNGFGIESLPKEQWKALIRSLVVKWSDTSGHRVKALKCHNEMKDDNSKAIEKEILAMNDELAERNRGWLDGRNILALNLVSSPGSGKTTLLEQTISDLGTELPICVTEGEDKPIKYPHMFRAAKVMILNKTDLLPYVKLDVDKSIEYARQVNPDIKVFALSATSGEGLDQWYDWLKAQVQINTVETEAAL